MARIITFPDDPDDARPPPAPLAAPPGLEYARPREPDPRAQLSFGQKMLWSAALATFLTAGWFAGSAIGGFGWLTWMGIAAAWHAHRQRRRREGAAATDPKRPRWRIGVAAMLAASLTLSAWWARCPHGTTIGFGPAGVCYSAVGGPCGGGTLGTKVARLSGNWYLVYRGG